MTHSSPVATARPRVGSPGHNLRVDDHDDPVAELRGIFDRVVAHVKQFEREYGAEGARLFGRVKW